MTGSTLCILGCGNLGTAILESLINASGPRKYVKFDRYIACVRSSASERRLSGQFSEHQQAGKLVISNGDNVKAVKGADIVILGVDPADVEATLTQRDLAQAIRGKLLISVAAGWTVAMLESILASAGGSTFEGKRFWILRALPNINALVSQSLTSIEDPGEDMPSEYNAIAESIFQQIGRTVRVATRLMDAATAVGGSTPALFAVICDGMIDAAVAVGVPRATAQAMIYQSMKGTAEMLQSGVHPGILKDQGTSPEGCTIGGLMVLEEAGIRGQIGKAIREAVTVARLLGNAGDDIHVNDTRK